MVKKLVSISIIIVVAGAIVFLSKEFITPQKVHYHAGFVVFQNNKKVNFSDAKYMYIEPCTTGNKKEDPETIQIEKAHLHDNVGDIVHIEKSGATWQDLFTNINYALDYTNTTGFINGKKTPKFQLQVIHPYDSLVVFIGKNDQKYLREAVTKKYIKIQEEKSDTCGE